MEDCEGNLKERKKKMTEKDRQLNKMTSRKTVLHQKVDECSEKINSLGPLPFDAFEKHQVRFVKRFTLYVT